MTATTPARTGAGAGTAASGLGSWLSGIYEPVGDELTADGLAIRGELPRALAGTYVRNGPNQRWAPPGPYHVFDGDGMLHAVTLHDGGASYRNRWIRSAGFLAEERAGRALYGGLLAPAFPSPEEVGDAGAMKNTANTHVVAHAGRLLALMEAARPIEVTLDLDTVGEHDFGGRLAGAFTAHPKIDPVTGEMLAFSYVGGLVHHEIDASGRLARSVPIELPAPVMMHDFAVTREHVVFLDAPAVMDLGRFLEGGPMVRWEPERGTRLGVLPRGGDARDVRWFEVEQSWVAHFLNAWTDGHRVVVHACRTGELNFGLDPQGADAAATGSLARFEIDLDAGRAWVEQLDDRIGDFPRVNDDRALLPTRYGYVAWFSGGSPGADGVFDAVVRYDLDRGTAEQYVWGPGFAVGELAFAPDPDGAAEDDGWLVGFVHDRAADRTDLVVLDARDVGAGPVAAVEMPRRVPFGFHGTWVADPRVGASGTRVSGPGTAAPASR